MSESTIEFTAVFSDENTAQNVKSILDRAAEYIHDASEEMFLHNALDELKETKGISFDSWWYPQRIELNGNVLYAEFVGSPSGTEEQDIVTWVKLFGVTNISGKAVMDGGGDVFVDEF